MKKLLLVLCAPLLLSSCLALGVAGVAVRTTGAVAGAAVKTTGAVVGAVIPDGDDDDKDKDRHRHHD